MRLIDADELKEDLRRYFTDGVLDGISARLAFNQILHDIDNAPTVKERPQGKWIEDWQEDLDFMSRKGWRCPFCNWRTTYGTPNFCMNCGADLRGEV